MNEEFGPMNGGALRPIALTRHLVAQCERLEPDPGPPPGVVPLTDEEYRDAAVEILAKLEGGPIWVFAYGSLLWKPVFEPIEMRPAVLHGWRRSFCLTLHRWRGSPTQPGLMLGLKRGGTCHGMAFRCPSGNDLKVLMGLLQRETTGARGLRCLQVAAVETPQGPEKALVFWAEPLSGDEFPEHDLSAAALILSRACGHIGSGASYLYETVTALARLGIHDEYMWQLQERVAAAIVAGLHLRPTTPGSKQLEMAD